MSLETASESRTIPETDTGKPSFSERFDTRRAVLGLLGTVGFVVAWWGAAQLTNPILVPGPIAVATAFGGELAAEAIYTLPFGNVEVALPRMVTKLFESLQHYLPGLFIGAVLGISVGIAMGWSETLDAAFTPVTRILRPIPPLAWIAFAIVWIGIGHAGATFIVAIGAFWINFYNAYSGVEGASSDLQEVATSLGIHDDRTMIRKVVLPDASPEIMTGIRTSIGQCWMIVVAAELFGAPGVGYQIINAAQNLAMDVSVVYMLVISAVFLVSDWTFRTVEGRILAWR